jgi:integrase
MWSPRAAPRLEHHGRHRPGRRRQGAGHRRRPAARTARLALPTGNSRCHRRDSRRATPTDSGIRDRFPRRSRRGRAGQAGGPGCWHARPGRSNRPASPAERRDAIAQAWRDEPGITDTILAERFGVSGRTIQRETQALQERGIQRRLAERRRISHRTRARYAAIYRRFLAWLVDMLGRPPTGQDLSNDVLARWIAQPASVGGDGWRGLSSASLRLECSALRLFVRHAGCSEVAASLRASQQQASPPETISPAQYERLLREPDLTTPVGLRDRAILRLPGDVGLRASEVCALNFEDIIWSADGQCPCNSRWLGARVGLSSSPPRRLPLWPAGSHIIRTGQPTGEAGSCRLRRHCSSRSGRRNPPARQHRGRSPQPDPAARPAGRDPGASAQSLCAAAPLGDPAGRRQDHTGPVAGSRRVAGPPQRGGLLPIALGCGSPWWRRLTWTASRRRVGAGGHRRCLGSAPPLVLGGGAAIWTATDGSAVAKGRASGVGELPPAW